MRNKRIKLFYSLRSEYILASYSLIIASNRISRRTLIRIYPRIRNLILHKLIAISQKRDLKISVATSLQCPIWNGSCQLTSFLGRWISVFLAKISKGSCSVFGWHTPPPPLPRRPSSQHQVFCNMKGEPFYRREIMTDIHRGQCYI
jgi:hypothetical protein